MVTMSPDTPQPPGTARPGRSYHCHVEVTVDVIGGKWTPVVLAHLKEHDRLRFAQLRRLIPDITEKMLAQRLRELEAIQIVDRIPVSTAPPHVEYALTAQGRSLGPVLQAMWEWGRDWAATNRLAVDPVQFRH
ncbi:Transcriptional regulator, HxlR family [Parafrankia sp. Ea1.12]|nr:Transcriptional regulator, HxlR family [Parafrankia sp. Ea1.12]